MILVWQTLSENVTYMWFQPQLYPFRPKAPTNARLLPQTARPTWNQKSFMIKISQHAELSNTNELSSPYARVPLRPNQLVELVQASEF